ncbi:hypothetical protein [Kitasatospora sp. NPDC002965]|uniref:hypothetical protein n=1 Tax=Kitasatospora sp. NPDC002965 TaxID=3154775 RepID=UPI0033ADF1D8
MITAHGGGLRNATAGRRRTEEPARVRAAPPASAAERLGYGRFSGPGCAGGRRALDTDVDAWRAVVHLPQAAGELLPWLPRLLADADLSQGWSWSEACALVAVLRQLGDPAAVPALAEALTTCVRQDQQRGATAALHA